MCKTEPKAFLTSKETAHTTTCWVLGFLQAVDARSWLLSEGPLVLRSVARKPNWQLDRSLFETDTDELVVWN